MVGLIVAILIVAGLIAVTIWLMFGRGVSGLFGPDERTDDEKHFPGVG